MTTESKKRSSSVDIAYVSREDEQSVIIHVALCQQ